MSGGDDVEAADAANETRLLFHYLGLSFERGLLRKDGINHLYPL